MTTPPTGFLRFKKSIFKDIWEINYFLIFWMFLHHPSKFGEISLKIGGEMICQSWPLLTPFFSFRIVHWGRGKSGLTWLSFGTLPFSRSTPGPLQTKLKLVIFLFTYIYCLPRESWLVTPSLPNWQPAILMEMTVVSKCEFLTIFQRLVCRVDQDQNEHWSSLLLPPWRLPW